MPRYTTQELSKTLFGRQHALTIWSVVMSRAIDPPELFKQQDLQLELRDSYGVPLSTSHKELLLMRDLGAVSIEPSRHSEGVVYTRAESAVWPFIAELVERAERSD